MSLQRTAQAERDLLDIWLWIARNNIAAADAMADKLDEVSTLLAANPRLGTARADIGRDIRGFPVKRWLILYRETGEGIEVVRYVHGARDLDDLPLD